MTTETEKTSKTQHLRNADPELWKQIKADAALKDETLTEWVERVARKALNHK